MLVRFWKDNTISQISHGTGDNIKQVYSEGKVLAAFTSPCSFYVIQHICSLNGEVIFWRQAEPHTLWFVLIYLHVDFSVGLLCR